MARTTLWAASAIWLSLGGGSFAGEVEWFRRLEPGYTQNDTRPLARFLEEWHTASKPPNDDIMAKKPAFEREVYALFQEWWGPSGVYDKVDYAIVQSSVEVVVVESGLGKLLAKGEYDRDLKVNRLPVVSSLSIHDFRPDVSGSGLKILYLDSEHLSDLVLFLTAPDFPEDVSQYWEEQNTSEERRKRLSYLNSALRIIPGHWDKGWHFETHPYVRGIYLNHKLDQAIVFIREHYAGGEVLMRKEGESWKVIHRDMNWTE